MVHGCEVRDESGFRVWGLRFEVDGSGLRVKGLVLRTVEETALSVPPSNRGSGV